MGTIRLSSKDHEYMYWLIRKHGERLVKAFPAAAAHWPEPVALCKALRRVQQRLRAAYRASGGAQSLQCVADIKAFRKAHEYLHITDPATADLKVEGDFIVICNPVAAEFFTDYSPSGKSMLSPDFELIAKA